LKNLFQYLADNLDHVGKSLAESFENVTLSNQEFNAEHASTDLNAHWDDGGLKISERTQLFG
jgi:hypothetical protein